MTAVLIILAVLILIFLVLLLPVTVDYRFDGESKFALKVLRFTLTKAKKPKRNITPSSQNVKLPEKKSKIKEIFLKKKEKEGFFGAVKDMLNLLKTLTEKTLPLIKKITVENLELYLTVASDDAAKTAIEYGALCTALYPTLSLIMSNAKVKAKKIDIGTDFNKTSYDFKASFTAKLRIIYLVKFIITLKKTLKEGKFYE